MTGVGAYFGAQCQKHGMLVRVAGDNIMMSPPFIITPEEVDEVGSLLPAITVITIRSNHIDIVCFGLKGSSRF